MADENINGENPENTETGGRTLIQPIEDEMKKSYIDYAMSVIVGRALPDVRDGLKPVHRRILYAMNEAGMTSDKPYKKSARIVGDVLGKYHPHGDTAVYDSLVRMAQDFSLRYPLIDGQGNFGSIDGDSAAAMRYTESRMAKIAGELISDIDKDTVDFTPNYDESMKEPTVLPAKLPSLLINGSSGIAVGMATNMPPHNITEVIDGTIHLIDNPEADVRELMEIITAPDFPTGGTIYGIAGILQAYTTGRGRIRVRAKWQTEQIRKDKTALIITEIPYMVNKSKLLEDIAHLVKDKRVEGITDLRDESDREGMRIVIELRRDANPEIVINQLYSHSQLQTTFGINNLALVDNQPRTMGLKEILSHYISHRKVVVIRRTKFELAKAERRAHILEGLLVALDNIDEVIAIIRKSKESSEAAEGLKARFLLSDEQTKAILDMRLAKLTNMERQGIKDEHAELIKIIARLKEILDSESEIYQIIKNELAELREKYGDKRRTEIVIDAIDLEIEDLIDEEDMVVTISNTGYIKRLPLDTYQTQRRGGVGRIGMETKDEDYVVDLFVCSTHDYILFFTNKGKVFWLKTYRIPVGGRHAKGKAIVNLLPELEKDEKVNAFIPTRGFSDEEYLLFATKKGTIKKTVLSAYSHPRVTGIKAIVLDNTFELGIEFKKHLKDGPVSNSLRDAFEENDYPLPKGATILKSAGKFYLADNGVNLYRVDERETKLKVEALTDRDELIGTRLTDGKCEILLATRNGLAVRFQESDVRPMGRVAKGVRGVRLREGDHVAGMAIVTGDETIFTITEKGYGKITPVEQYRKTKRGARGVITIKTHERNGPVLTIRSVLPGDELIISTIKGMIIRIPVNQIRVQGRATMGVRIMRLKPDDQVISLAALIPDDEELDEDGEPIKKDDGAVFKEEGAPVETIEGEAEVLDDVEELPDEDEPEEEVPDSGDAEE